MRKLKRLFLVLKLKFKGYTKDNINTVLVLKNLMTFEEYEKYYDNKVRKEFK